MFKLVQNRKLWSMAVKTAVNTSQRNFSNSITLFPSRGNSACPTSATVFNLAKSSLPLINNWKLNGISCARMSSTLKKRRTKMNKHKLKKRNKRRIMNTKNSRN